MTTSWSDWLKRTPVHGGRTENQRQLRNRRRSRRSFRPRLEALEDRSLPSTFTVMNLNDSGPGSLRAAIAAANTNPGPDTIDFADGLSGTITLTTGELLITDSVTINGPGAKRLSVSGNDSSRVFDVSGSTTTATMNGLTITHGRAADQAGGILNQGGTLNLTDDVLSHNVVVGSVSNGGRGGAIRNRSGTLAISDCTITGNEALAGPKGNGIGGGIYSLGGTVTISDSTVSGNLAVGGNNTDAQGFAEGGGIASFFDTLTVQNSTFTGNSVVAGSGGSNANIFGGLGNGDGGAMFINGSAAGISGSTFTGNLAFGGDGGTSAYAGNALGGAIWNLGSVTISTSTFTANAAIAGSGGQSAAGSIATSVDGGFGGAIENDGSVQISQSAFSGNAAVGGSQSSGVGTDLIGAGFGQGGAIDNEGGASATISDSSFDHNQALGGDSNSGSGRLTFIGTGLGGAVASTIGGGAVGAPNPLTIGNSTFDHNSALGGDNNTGSGSVVAFIGTGLGGAVWNDEGSTATISASTLTHNQASGGAQNTASGAGTLFAGTGAGGAVFNDLGNVLLLSVGGNVGPTVLTITNSVLDHNEADGGGGGLGGAIANLFDAATTIDGSSLDHNQANGKDGGAGLSGGAYNDATSSLSLTKSLVTHNLATGSPGIGGGIYTLGVFTSDASTVIKHNHASTSGDDVGP
jgi:hypothetical protein